MGGASSIGTAVSLGGSLMGAMGSNDVSTDIPTGQMNSLLDNALQNGLDYSQNYTNQAVGAQKDYLSQALKQLQAGQNALQAGYDTSQALQSPYRDAGYGALDSYMDSLMLARPEMGSRQYAGIQGKEADTQSRLKSLLANQQDLNTLYDTGSLDPYNLPDAPTLEGLAKKVSDADKMAYIKQNTTTKQFSPYDGQSDTAYIYNGALDPYTPDRNNQIFGAGDIAFASNGGYNNLLGAVGHNAANALAQQRMGGAQSTYDQMKYNYNNLGDFLQNQYTPEQQRQMMAIKQGLFSAPTLTKVGQPLPGAPQ